MKLFGVRLTTARTVLLAGLIFLTLAVSAIVVAVMPAKYEAKSQAVLIGPTVVGGKPTNPFLDFSQALSVTLDVLIVASSDADTVRQIVANGGTSHYTVARSHEISDSEPIITVTGTAPSGAQAIQTTKLVMAFLDSNLRSRQTAAAVPSNGQVKMVSITTPEQARRQWKTPIEIGLVILVLGLLGSVLLFVALDRYLSRRTPSQAAPTRSQQHQPYSRRLPTSVPARRTAGRAGQRERPEVWGDASSDSGPPTAPNGRRRWSRETLSKGKADVAGANQDPGAPRITSPS